MPDDATTTTPGPSAAERPQSPRAPQDPGRRQVLGAGLTGFAALGVTSLALPLASASASTGGGRATAGQVDVTFTNAGATGRLGPAQADVDTAYAVTALAGQVTVADGIQTWRVPLSGTYRITASGARGGIGLDSTLSPGLGAVVEGIFELDAGTDLRILVGQMGGNQLYGAGDVGGAGGGGGTFVVRATAGAPTLSDALLVAGGGGGPGGGGTSGTRRAVGNGWPGLAPDADGCGSIAVDGSGTGGCLGQGGVTPAASNFCGGAGGGLLTDGTTADDTTYVGRSFVNGGAGGQLGTGTFRALGGFGGGGAGTFAGGGGGGAGGGAGGRGTDPFPAGGGGGSLNRGSAPSATAGSNNGHGQVRIQSV